MKPSSRAFLKELLETPSPSGFETRGQQLWIDYVKPFADKVTVDSYGNAFATINPEGSPKILFSGHMDEIGMMVSFISEEGFLYFKGIGGIDQTLVRGQRVTIHSSSGPIPGVTGLLAIHLQEPEDRKKVPHLHEMYIDIGASSRKEAEKLVHIGDAITYTAGFVELAGGRFAARGCDNRIGAWAAAEAFCLVAKNRKNLKASVVAVSTIQEENGLYGASMAGYSIHPDVALVVDVTHATDIPNCSKPQHGDVRLGKGPVLSVGSTNHPIVNELLRSVAKSKKIALQVETNPRWTGTDADAIFCQKGGIPTVSIGVPNRYMHSPVEMIHFSDLQETAELLAAFALAMKKKEQLKLPLNCE
ncbi:MAG: M42 family metallopeptidase [Verrucomicrobiae bacterium]|jgi:endoglucanase|nr:M42 family metallopeptidase [Verrucomicrobiae bacterium]